ncbi:diacylglycerol/lipid kinase family protein [Nitratireductor basaltis]|uniref:Diacylglycerol kinase, catalytic region n=1 Tax=Nitratireductor basaltis TaxID=472175 RepID=A0A084U7F2_9HYPH|nr:diacylglycerol kinase family protein [Nitratireductor basaltis]KFB08888.1 Diacylglycerol kinase, catalytic region [Nitratireductor basaltis]
MQILAILNRDGGTLSSLDIEIFSTRLTELLREEGHEIEVRAVAGRDIVSAIDEAAVAPDVEVVIAGGGDGTISLAAGKLAGTEKALAVLPAGTMNLFARSLGMPLDLDLAIKAFAKGQVKQVDLASMNGRYLVHQFSIGMHPQLIDLRKKLSFRGRIGKILASSRAALTTLKHPHNILVKVETNKTRFEAVTQSLSVTNNLYGEGHLPFTDQPDGGTLGVYVTRAARRSDLFFFFANMAIGRWRRNDKVEIHEATEVKITLPYLDPRFKCAIDGELEPLSEEIVVKLHPKVLRVLVPDTKQE